MRVLSSEAVAALKGDMVFLALDQASTRAVRPYISGTLPIYTTSLGIDPRAEATVNVDLEGVRYVDMPWFVQPDHPAVMVYPQPTTSMAVEQERLEAWIMQEVQAGAELPGLYPPNENNRARYEDWKRAR